ncbi:MAG: FAD:protein FMN transferase [Paludibacteraceae bacterium]|nr:FAD:protein FMN transferase [Paludibacteraceae bacterium]
MSDNKQKYKIALTGVLAVLALLLLALPGKKESNTTTNDTYFQHEGNVFGTYYNIRYEANHSLEEVILQRFTEFDNSLSTFNPQSTISVLNQGRDTIWDAYFTRMYDEAQAVCKPSHGALEIRVAPLVNAWGFGFKNKEQVTPELIDSLLQIKNILDASAIAKGYACDVIADLMKENGVNNYLVDIGGEVVLNGVNREGNSWRIGIAKPIDDKTGQSHEIQQVISSTNLCMATSGNYRQYYYEDGEKRSHTIDPRTGYPAKSDLLSATIVAPSCIRADALATACMVLGSDSALMLINSLPQTECYLICSTPADTLCVITSEGFPL